jgi:hypothetical protein
MFVLEYKLKGKEYQYRAIDEAIRTAPVLVIKSYDIGRISQAKNSNNHEMARTNNNKS